MNRVLLIVLLIGASNSSRGQSGLSIQGGVTFFITSANTVYIDGLALTPSVNYSIGAPNSVARNTTLTHNATNPYISRVFSWTDVLSSYSGTVTIYYLLSDLNGIPESNLTLNDFNGTAWSPLNTGITRDQINHFVTTAGLTNVSLQELALANSVSPLPLKWGPINAYRRNIEVKVEWLTYDESNVLHLQVEKSLDGNSWTPASESLAAYNTPGEHRYTWEDLAAGTGRVFYRIREEDMDGHSVYSPVATAGPLLVNAGLMVYPNPTAARLTISANSGIRSVMLYTLDGRLVREERPGGAILFDIDIHSFSAGVYYLAISLSDGSIWRRQIIKQ